MAGKEYHLNADDSDRLFREIIYVDLSRKKNIKDVVSMMSISSAGYQSIKTDFTVSPIFFKGGDIGKLSVAGTVNDLSVMGARPLFLSLGLIKVFTLLTDCWIILRANYCRESVRIEIGFYLIAS